MALVPSESRQSPPSDRFSSLPNELLDDIFEYAYEQSCPAQPLSKRLLPYFEIHLYRKPRLSSAAQCSLFLVSISAKPRKGRLVDKLDLSALRRPTKADHDLLEALLPLLPNLSHLQSHILTSLFKRNLDARRLLSRLQSLVVRILPKWNDGNDQAHVDLEQLVYLRHLPELRELTLIDWGVYHEHTLRGGSTVWLPLVEQLRVEGPGAEDDSVRHLTANCPILRHLALHSTWQHELYIFAALKEHPITLESLSLSAETSMVVNDYDYDLERLTRLQSIHLGQHCYNRTIYVTLSHLPSLVEIHLGQGPFDFHEFASLISGPTRLLFLKLLTFDCDTGYIGQKISAPSREDFDATREMQRCSIEMNDWRLPDFIGGNGFDMVGMERFLEGAEENGVTVNEEIRSALQTIEDYYLEANNRAVIAAYYKQLWSLRQMREIGRRTGSALFGSDGLGTLEIVELDLPARNWFALDLRSVRK